MADVILQLDQLKKSFRSYWTFLPIEAVKGVSLEVYRGESFGFLGHNGAGKTTTIKCILGLIHKTGGRILFNGEEKTSPDVHSQIGYLPEHPYFYDHLTVHESLDFFASLHGIRNSERRKRVSETLEVVGLADRHNASVRSLSKGLQQRLGFAQAIINRPQLLLLDEPFSGLDPLGRLEIRNIILDLNREGTTVFLSSHILSDVEHICDRVSIMASGELKRVFALKDSPDLFGRQFELTVELTATSEQLHDQLVAGASDYEIYERAAGKLATYRFGDYQQASHALQTAIAEQIKVIEFKSCSSSLEEIFMEITEANRDTSTEELHP